MEQEKYLRELLKQAIMEVFSQKQDLFSNLMKEALKDMASVEGEKKSFPSFLESLLQPPLASPESPSKGKEEELLPEETFPPLPLEERAVEERTVEENPEEKLFQSILQKGFSPGVQSIHFQPQEKNLLVRYKIYGNYQDDLIISEDLKKYILVRLKILANMDIAEKRRPQDGGFKLEKEGRKIYAFASTIPTIAGERVTIRFSAPEEREFFHLEDLGFRKEEEKILRSEIEKKSGLILVAGPSESGKTTLLYTLLQEISSRRKNIISIENSLEKILPNINQVEVCNTGGPTLSQAILSARRQEAEVICARMEDSDSAQMLIQTALLGGLVLSSIHTFDFDSTLHRLCDMGLSGYGVASTLSAVVSCRLVRKICSSCKEETPITSAEAEILGREGMVFRGTGCERCHNTGFWGKTGLYEVVPIEENLRRKIIYSFLKKDSWTDPLTPNSLWERGKEKVLQGETTLKELLSVLDGRAGGR